ncbi:MAG: outer membrane beta-barrel protein [Flavobacteriales bacterium]
MKKSILFIIVTLISQWVLATELESDSSQVTPSVFTEAKAARPDLIFIPPNLNQNYNAVVSQVSSFGAVTREELKTPIQFNLSVEKRLDIGEDKRFSVGLGAGLLLVKSTLVFQDYNTTTEQDITRSYFTAPVYLKYDYLQDRRVRLFVTAGVSSEFGLSAKISEEVFSFGESVSSETSSEKLYSGQFNVNLGTGINVKVAKHLSLFTEASAAHYYWESTNTIWSERAVWFNLKCGVNLQF